jgi:hypothetical protein
VQIEINKKRLYRILVWIITNGLLAFLAVQAAVYGNAGAGNIVVFAVWFFTIVYLLSLWVLSTPVPEAEELRKTLKNKFSVPAWVSTVYDVGLTLFFVWHSWWFTAVAMAVMHFLELCIRDHVNRVSEKS